MQEIDSIYIHNTITTYLRWWV